MFVVMGHTECPLTRSPYGSLRTLFVVTKYSFQSPSAFRLLFIVSMSSSSLTVSTTKFVHDTAAALSAVKNWLLSPVIGQLSAAFNAQLGKSE
jgi:hypothetical protein